VKYHTLKIRTLIRTLINFKYKKFNLMNSFSGVASLLTKVERTVNKMKAQNLDNIRKSGFISDYGVKMELASMFSYTCMFLRYDT
jgi:hypothetical protein